MAVDIFLKLSNNIKGESQDDPPQRNRRPGLEPGA